MKPSLASRPRPSRSSRASGSVALWCVSSERRWPWQSTSALRPPAGGPGGPPRCRRAGGRGPWTRSRHPTPHRRCRARRAGGTGDRRRAAPSTDARSAPNRRPATASPAAVARAASRGGRSPNGSRRSARRARPGPRSPSPDHMQGMIGPDPLLRIHIGRQRAAPAALSAHPTFPRRPPRSEPPTAQPSKPFQRPARRVRGTSGWSLDPGSASPSTQLHVPSDRVPCRGPALGRGDPPASAVPAPCRAGAVRSAAPTSSWVLVTQGVW